MPAWADYTFDPQTDCGSNAPLMWNREAKRNGVRHSVFCASLADVFDDHPSIDAIWREEFWDLVYETHNLDWLLLTKHPEHITSMLPDGMMTDPVWGGPCPNIHIGVSVEDQATADERIPELLRRWSGPNFVCYAPALGPVNFRRLRQQDEGGEWFIDSLTGGHYLDHGGYTVDVPIYRAFGNRPMGTIHWIIAGDKSGARSRTEHPNWFQSVHDQCRAAGVPFSFRQWNQE